MPHHQELATAAAAAVGGWVGSWGDERDGGNQRNGVIMLHRDTSIPEPSPEPGARRKIISYTCCGCTVAATGRLELAIGFSRSLRFAD